MVTEQYSKDELIPSMQSTLFEETYISIKDTLIEITEAGLDQVLENGLVREIPVIRTIASLCKTGYNIHERNLIRQTAKFITEFNNGTISDADLENHRQALNNDPKKAEKELSRVMLLLSNNIDSKKSKILGSFYRNYVKGNINWEEFCELSDANSRMFIGDYEIIEDLMCEPKYEKRGHPSREMHRIHRLQALGFITEKNVVTADKETITFLGTNQKYDISALGKLFARMMEE